MGGAPGDVSPPLTSPWQEMTDEMYSPMTIRGCSVGDQPQRRFGHSMCNNMLCGGAGGNSSRTCQKFDGISTFTSLPVRLVEEREWHLCWGLKSGDVLLFGDGRFGTPSTTWPPTSTYRNNTVPLTTERVSADGSSSQSGFTLPYKIG